MMSPWKVSRIFIWSSTLCYLGALLVGTWLFFAALGISQGWPFQPIPPSVNSAAFTSEVTVLVDGSVLYVFTLFIVFLVLWFGFGVIYWGNVSARWRQMSVIVLGALLVAYGFLLPYWILGAITGVASIVAIYFLLVVALALSGPSIYWLAAQNVMSRAGNPRLEFVDAIGALEKLNSDNGNGESGDEGWEPGNGSLDSGLLEPLHTLAREADRDLTVQEQRVKGSIFSMLKSTQNVAVVQESVGSFTRELRRLLIEELNGQMNVVNDPRFGEGMREALIEELVQKDHQIVVSLYSRGRENS